MSVLVSTQPKEEDPLPSSELFLCISLLFGTLLYGLQALWLPRLPDLSSSFRGTNGLYLGTPTLYHSLEVFCNRVISFVTCLSGNIVLHCQMFHVLKIIVSYFCLFFELFSLAGDNVNLVSLTPSWSEVKTWRYRSIQECINVFQFLLKEALDFVFMYCNLFTIFFLKDI